MIKNITVLGSGTMGHGIAHVFARQGYEVSIYEPFASARETAMPKIESELQFLVDESYITKEEMVQTTARISVYEDLKESAKNADYIVEACPEQLALKQELFGKLDKICPAHTIFATNTSSLKLKEITAYLPEERKARCIITHWYNPPYLLPIVELSKFGNMDESLFQEIYDLHVKCEKEPVSILKDVPGMIANRMLHAQAREAFYLVENGVATAEDIDRALKYGPCFRNATTGMLETADMGGLDIWTAGEDNMFPELNNSDKASDFMRNHVTAGELGFKTGKGFFEYPEDKKEQIQKDFYRRLLIQLKASREY